MPSTVEARGLNHGATREVQESFFFSTKFYWSIVDLQGWVTSAVPQSEPLYIYIDPLFWILFSYRSIQSIESSSLGYTVGSYYLFSI